MTVPLRIMVEKAWNFGPRSYWTGRDRDEVLHRFVWGEVKQAPLPGEVWEVSGHQERHPEYGLQWKVSTASWIAPRGKLIVQFLARHEAFSGLGIGIARASALYAHLGDSLYEVLSMGDESKLREVQKLPPACIQPLIQAWRRIATKTDVVRWLAKHDVSFTLASKILAFYGTASLEKLQENPYRLLAFTAFRECDRVAKSIGISDDDPRRLVAVVQNCLYKELSNGNTVTPPHILTVRASPFFTSDALANARNAISTAVHNKAVIDSKDGLSTAGVRALEFDLQTRISEILNRSKSATCDSDPLRAIQRCEMEAGFSLNDAQRQAVSMGLTESLSILCGAAGSGKTTVLKALCYALPWSAYQIALTGQAAKRMIEATAFPATTIEFFLRNIVKTLPRLTSPLVIVDEASMLDLPLTVRILRSVPPTTRLLLVGDPAQLPPIGFGLVFHRLVESRRVPTTELTHINRQAESSGIPGASRSIRDGTVPNLQKYSRARPGVFFFEAPRGQILQRLIDVKADQPDAQILAIKNRGGLGILDINEVFHRIHGGGKKHIAGLPFSIGEPVIFKKNIGELNLVNGSLGTVVEIVTDAENGPTAVCDFTGEIKSISGDNLEFLRHAYAITVHSAQGSQFNRVIVVVEESQLLDRTLIYTALTRGIVQVTFIGNQKAFALAVISAPSASKRRVWFKL